MIAILLQRVTSSGASDALLENAVGILLALVIGQAAAGVVALIGLNAKVNTFMSVQFPALQRSLEATNKSLEDLRTDFNTLQQTVVRHDERLERLLSDRREDAKH